MFKDLPVKLTHKGWFGFCPVFFGNLESVAPLVVERHWLLLPIMILNEWIFGGMFFFATLINPEYEPEWPLRVTGELHD